MKVYSALDAKVTVHKVDGVAMSMHPIEWPARLFYEIVRQNCVEECDQFLQDFARSIRDYLAMASIGEARYSGNVTLVKGRKSRTIDRETIYAESIQYDPTDILTYCEFVFSHWNGMSEYIKPNVISKNSMGGPKWGLIAKRGAYYGRISNTMYIDHILDLSHNRALVWNKPVIFPDTNSDGLREFLDNRAKVGREVPIEYPYHVELVQLDWKHKVIEQAYVYWNKDWIEMKPPFCHGQCDKLHPETLECLV